MFNTLGSFHIDKWYFEECHIHKCPFDWINEHDEWFEFHKRLYFDNQPTWLILKEMKVDYERVVKARRISIKFSHNPYPILIVPQAIALSTV